ncbi:M36 family metallopeptidase [Nannocystis sp. RBIL2]|uniref:M36 family metallopeptidase n=1 Tax=Nannocystis sp. RBIL2 TaxID=2996788 RepID=UPI00226EA12E|nr:M36 family metallopeptidase [Nannocystis sp. RBIL2]MCY1071392.1 M36 family metallopeptidase [Nannocystis sp. RBIL2]
MTLCLVSSFVMPLALVAADAPVGQRSNFDASAFAPEVAPTPVHGGLAVARAPGLGSPSLMWISHGQAQPAGRSPESAARSQLAHHLDAYGATPEVLAGARTLFVHDTGRGGIIVALRQTVGGVDLHHGDVKLLLDRSLRLLAVSGALHPGAHPGAARPFTTSPEAAIAAALRDLHGDAVTVPLVEIEGRNQWRRFAASGPKRAAGQGLRFAEPARARPIYFPLGETLVPAYLVELQTRLGAKDDVFQYVVAADDGRLLMRRDATLYAHQYRVYADPVDRRPLDGPLVDFNPHPTGFPNVLPDGYSDAALVTVEGLNTNPDGVPDPWLPANATQTVGNNVDTYIDPKDTDPVVDRFRATVTAPGVFDRVYDFTQAATANDEQIMTALTHAFYVTNWQHDWWYDSGLVEATGNAQLDNYGRGGEDDDPMLVEVLNGWEVGLRNNASMSLTLDGVSPRLRLRLFDGIRKLSDLSVDPLGLVLDGQVSEFGPAVYDVTAPLVLGDDGAGANESDGCEPLINDVAGKIVLVDRGECIFETQAKNILDKGAVGVLIADDVAADEPVVPLDDLSFANPNIPTLGLTLAEGDVLKDALEGPALTVHMAAEAGPTRDAGLDSQVIAHEFGHYLHNRLVEWGSPTCLAASEGWGDFNALLMSIREGDDLHGALNISPWSSIDPTQYWNWRQYVYSTDFAVNPLTFRHIGDDVQLPEGPLFSPTGFPNSQQHNAGQVWAQMLWDSYVALQELHADDIGFEAVRRRMSDYVVAGMMLAPYEPTFTEQRDALLMAIAATSEDDMLAVAAAFADRGAGTCAESPPRFSTTLEGVVEDYELRGRGVLLGANFDDSVVSCDQDGILDDEETGRVAFEVYNGGVVPLAAGATVEIVEPPPGLVFPDGPVVTLPELAPQQTSPYTIAVTLDPGITEPTRVALRVRLTAPGGCEAPVEQIVHATLSADVAPTGASEDDVEVAASAWTPTGDAGASVWTRESGPDGHAWHGKNLGAPTDTALVSPAFTVAGDQDFSLAFDHAYAFDAVYGIAWDGGVIELSSDDGQTWYDAAQVGDVGYSGKIQSAENPLVLRSAFVKTSLGYPQLSPVVIHFGTALAGQTMRIRFRIATDPLLSQSGWTLDNFHFQGLVDGPFPRLVGDAGACQPNEETTTSETGESTSETGESTSDTDASTSDTGAPTSDTGAPTSDTEAPTSGPGEPTSGPGEPTSGPGEPTSGPGESSDTSSEESDSGGMSAGGEAGCGCVADPRGGWLTALALPLLALRRRRRVA